MPDDFIKPRSNSKYVKMKAENELPNTTFMSPEAMGNDPLAQIKKSLNNKEENNMTEKVKLKAEDKPEEDDKCNKELPEEKPEEKAMEEVDEEDDDKKKKKKAKKAAGAESPSEDAASATDDNSTLSPGASVPSTPQDVFVPQSGISVAREQSTPMGKSVEPDLLKSPLFVNLSKQLDGIREAVSNKITALEKSVNDRLNNVLKDMDKIEKFYKQSFYKAIDENVAPESVQRQSISKQIADGEVRYRQK